VDCLAGYGSVGFVVEERSVGGVRVPVETVAGQCGHVVLLRLPLIVGPLVCGKDDQRLAVEAGQGRRLLHRSVRHSILLDEACKRPPGGMDEHGNAGAERGGDPADSS
jgi:hypothetical protein